MDEDSLKISIDPHVHSEASFDGKEPVELILEHAKDIGLDAVVITDHDEIEASLEAAELAEDYGLIGVPGVEISTKAGHVLGIGVEEKPEKKLSIGETMKKIREFGGAAVIPHPFQRTRHGVKKRKVKNPDAIEIYNSWLFTGYQNRRARKFARNRDIPGVAASDAHSVAAVGRAYTEVEIEGKNSKQDLDYTDIVEAIKSDRNNVYGRRVPIHRSAGHYMKGMFRKTVHFTRRLR